MLHFLSQTSFYWWLVGGSTLALLSGFFAMSEGSFFKSARGQVFVSICGLALIAIIVRIGFLFHLLAGGVSLLVFWTVLGYGGRLFRPKY